MARYASPSPRNPSIHAPSFMYNPQYNSAHAGPQAKSRRIDQDNERLPSGKCGFRDLKLGHSCGCRRFCLSKASDHGIQRRNVPANVLGSNGDLETWCFCGHHACFHKLRGESASPEQQFLAPHQPTDGQRHPSVSGIGLGINENRTKPDINRPHRLVARDTAPTECSDPLPSTAPSETGGHYRSSLNRTFMDHVGRLRHLDIMVDQGDATYAPTDIASPVPDVRQLEANPDVDQRTTVTDNPSQAATPPANNESESIERILAQLASANAAIANTPNFQQSLLTLSNRIDALESSSFGHGPVEELQEKLDLFDYRLLETEGKIEDLERARSFVDEELRRSAARVSRECHANPDTDFRLDSIDQRVTALEDSSLPSPRQPWGVEVVLLPWGPQLKGIWSEDVAGAQLASLTSSGYDTAMGPTQSLPVDHMHVDDDGVEDNRLRARACGPSQGIAGIIHERLRSRGLVRHVDLRSNNPLHVYNTVTRAFSDFIRTAHISSQHSVDNRVNIVPLRKVHRSSRLHFLSNSEFADSSIWAADYLEMSVFMKAPRAGLRRLYITTSEAYSQQDSDRGLTWQKLREMPRFHQTSDSSPFVGEGDAREECWSWDARVDPVPDPQASSSSSLSWHSSFESHLLSPKDSKQSLESESRSENESIREDQLSYRPTPSPLTPVSESLHITAEDAPLRRTTSMPATQTQNANVSFSKRQVASFEVSATAALYPTLAKRRRISSQRIFSFPGGSNEPLIGDSEPHDVDLFQMWNLTPRRSHEPPSPRSSLARINSPAPVAKGKTRALVEQLYATPFSHIPEDFNDEANEGGGGTNADEIDAEHDSHGHHDGVRDVDDDVWEGVIEEDSRLIVSETTAQKQASHTEALENETVSSAAEGDSDMDYVDEDDASDDDMSE